MTEEEIDYVFVRIVELVQELKKRGIESEDAYYDLKAAYNLLKSAVRHVRCADLED